MKDLTTLKHFGMLEDLTNILMKKTQNNNPAFFRLVVAYNLAKVASTMRVNIETHDRGTIPVNMYALNLGLSGSGKGYSTNIIEESVIKPFKERFLDETLPIISERHLAKLAVQRANRGSDDPDEVLEAITREYNSLGPLVFSFDSGTSPAVKQMRQKLLMADCGSVNLEIDEIGSNLINNTEVLNTFLELYDVGKIKQKLIKNTNDNKRSEEIDGRTPTNMMLFGVPQKLLDGGPVENALMSFFDTGYARRCFFAYSTTVEKDNNLTPEQIYDMLTDKSANTYMDTLADKLYQLADLHNFNRTLTMTKDISLLFIEYKLKCDKEAALLKEHQQMRN